MQGNYVILVGTGDVDNLVEATKIDAIQHRVVSLLEERQLQSTGGATALSSESSITANWEQVLVTGESVTGPLSLFDQVTYFGTFVSPQTDNACDFGNSRIWALDYMQADTSNNPLPRWPDGVGEDNKPKYVEYVEQELEDALVLGVSIATTPLCVSKTETDPFSPMARVAADAQIGGGGYQIRALLSGRRNATSGASEVTGFQKSLMTSSNARSVGWGGAVE